MYDLIVIGGGPGGYSASESAGRAGLKTLLIEKNALGGVCLNEGCIPTKTFLHSAKIYDYSRYSEKYGVTAKEVTFNHSTVLTRKNKVVKSLVAGVGATVKKCGVEIVDGFAQIKGRGTDGFTIAVGNTEYKGRYMIIATGSDAIVPPISGVEDAFKKGIVQTNREILNLAELPESLTVIGGGVVGLEFASYFNSAGVKVTVIEMLNRIAGNTDKSVSAILLKNMSKRGIDFRLGCKVTKIEENKINYQEIDTGKDLTIDSDKILMSIGRKPVINGFGLESLNVELDKNAIKTDDSCKTNISGLYAVGDVNGRSMLAHTAYREAEAAVNNILGNKDRVRYNTIPAVIYTNPEIAGVGETPESALEKGFDIKVLELSMKYSGRYLAENEEGDGICKLVLDNKYNRLLGAHMLGSYVSEFIVSAAMMIDSEMPVEEIKKIVFPHPTVSEIIRETVLHS